MSSIQHILIVEDDWMTRNVLGDYLGDKGYRISRAENGLGGLRALEKGDIDLVITDYAMPAMGGGELIIQLRKTNPHLPVILISGFSRRDVKGFDLIKDHLHDYFMKPVNLVLLQSSIQKVPSGVFA
jgi:two-component system, OmpR family, copper resistance phosphate regulon response regulator CusR